jgi:hypothetical protein
LSQPFSPTHLSGEPAADKCLLEKGENFLAIPTLASQDRIIAKIITSIRKYEEYPSYYKPISPLILRHGRPWYIGERTFAGRRARRKQCYMNSYTLVDRNPGLIYVEGWCWKETSFAHAWCIDAEGQVIDPTLREADGYYGIPFRWEYVQATASRTMVYGVISNSDSDLLTAPAETFIDDIART